MCIYIYIYIYSEKADWWLNWWVVGPSALSVIKIKGYAFMFSWSALLHDSKSRMCELAPTKNNPMAIVIAPISCFPMQILMPCICLQSIFTSQLVPCQPVVCLHTGVHVVSEVAALAIGVHWDAPSGCSINHHPSQISGSRQGSIWVSSRECMASHTWTYVVMAYGGVAALFACRHFFSSGVFVASPPWGHCAPGAAWSTDLGHADLQAHTCREGCHQGSAGKLDHRAGRCSHRQGGDKGPWGGCHQCMQACSDTARVHRWHHEQDHEGCSLPHTHEAEALSTSTRGQGGRAIVAQRAG